MLNLSKSHMPRSVCHVSPNGRLCVFMFLLLQLCSYGFGKTPHMTESNKLNLMDGVKMHSVNSTPPRGTQSTNTKRFPRNLIQHIHTKHQVQRFPEHVHEDVFISWWGGEIMWLAKCFLRVNIPRVCLVIQVALRNPYSLYIPSTVHMHRWYRRAKLELD